MKQRFTLKHPPSRGDSRECGWVAQVDRRHPPPILQNAAANLKWWLDLHVWGLWFLVQPGPWHCSVTNAWACLLHPKPAAVGWPTGRGWGVGGRGRYFLVEKIFLKNISLPTSQLMQCMERSSSSTLGLWASSSHHGATSPGGFTSWVLLQWNPLDPPPCVAPIPAVPFRTACECRKISHPLRLPSGKQVFNIPMPSSAIQQSVGLICIIKPCCKMLSWSNLVGEQKYREWVITLLTLSKLLALAQYPS